MLSQIVLVPLLALFTLGYIAMRPASGRGAGMVVYDAVVIFIAAGSSIAAGRLIAGLEPVSEHSIWLTVMTTMAAFHIFPAVLLTGWYFRRRLFGERRGP